MTPWVLVVVIMIVGIVITFVLMGKIDELQTELSNCRKQCDLATEQRDYNAQKLAACSVELDRINNYIGKG